MIPEFRARKYSSEQQGLYACTPMWNALIQRRLRRLCTAAVGAIALAALLICACRGAAGEAAQATDSAQAKAKLAAVRSRISELTQHLGRELHERDELSARLRDAELEITEKRRRLEDLRIAEAAAERRRTQLRAEQSRDQDDLAAERETLGLQMRAAYMIGREEQLKLLLNQNNPAALGRTLAYYEYFAEQRSATIANIERQLTRLQQLVAEIDEQSDKLKSLEEAVARQVAALQSARADRADSMAAISKQLASGNQELAKLRQEEQAVESLIADLARVLQDFPTDPSRSFEQMRGKLPWPVPGRVSAQYQTSRAGSASSVRWNGVMIATARGAKVRAPYFGRVVYADWLQGLGLLLIVAHSGGYMTLYGHAEVLYKSVGDWVAPGDVIAAMNDTAGEPQLYFEIREGRKTVDPKAWLRINP
jgi:septal ring factor EnvC (AmiA/AmiB activator)